MLLMGKSTISMFIFNSYVKLPEDIHWFLKFFFSYAAPRPILLLYPFMHSFVRSFVRDFLRTYIVGGFNYFIPNTCIQTALFDLPHPPLNQSEALRTSVGARPPACWRFVNETSLALTLFQRDFPQKQTDAQHIRILPGWIIRGYRLSEEFL